METEIDRRNQKVYSDAELVGFYANRSFLYQPEEFILARYAGEVRGARILDLGVGAGRTTAPLLALSERYVGADYALEMVERCRARFAGVDFRHSDARDMRMFPDGSFDVVFFSSNAIDHVEHEDRLRILREVHRILRHGGLFIFSSHNLDWTGRRSPYDPRSVVVHQGTPRLRRSWLRVRGYLAGMLNYRRSRKYERRGDGYAMLAYPIHNYRLVLYFTTLVNQIAQLESQGFGDVEAVDMRGDLIGPGGRPGDMWIHYAARKR